MPKTLLRGLDLIEVVDLEGPLTISEIARRTGTDVSTASRTVAACERDGWLVRHEGRVLIGPRCALLGLTSPATQAIRAAEPIVRAIAAATSLTTTASALVGREAMILAAAPVSVSASVSVSVSASVWASVPVSAETAPAIPVGVSSRTPIHILADGLAIAAQLSAAQLDRLLPPEPFPGALVLGGGSAVAGFVGGFPGAGDPPSVPDPLARTRAELDRLAGAIRADGFSRDNGTQHPAIGCIARPWPTAGLPSAIACVGHRDQIAAHRALIEACLVAATQPGASARDVIVAAAEQIGAGGAIGA